MKKNIKELDGVDLDDLLEKIEQEAVKIETNFINMYSEQAEEAQRVPVFDFEIN